MCSTRVVEMDGWGSMWYCGMDKLLFGMEGRKVEG